MNIYDQTLISAICQASTILLFFITMFFIYVGKKINDFSTNIKNILIVIYSLVFIFMEYEWVFGIIQQTIHVKIGEDLSWSFIEIAVNGLLALSVLNQYRLCSYIKIHETNDYLDVKREISQIGFCLLNKNKDISVVHNDEILNIFFKLNNKKLNILISIVEKFLQFLVFLSFISILLVKFNICDK